MSAYQNSKTLYETNNIYFVRITHIPDPGKTSTQFTVVMHAKITKIIDVNNTR